MEQDCKECLRSFQKGRCQCGRYIYICAKWDNIFGEDENYEEDCGYYDIEEDVK